MAISHGTIEFLFFYQYYNIIGILTRFYIYCMLVKFNYLFSWLFNFCRLFKLPERGGNISYLLLNKILFSTVQYCVCVCLKCFQINHTFHFAQCTFCINVYVFTIQKMFRDVYCLRVPLSSITFSSPSQFLAGRDIAHSLYGNMGDLDLASVWFSFFFDFRGLEGKKAYCIKNPPFPGLTLG